MSKNLNQVPTAASSLLSTDKMYIARSPFDATDDRYILGSSLITQFGSPLTTKGDIWTYSTGQSRLPVGADGTLLQANSAATNGIDWTTATYPATTTINQLLYSSSANVVAGLATANSATLITDSGGVPSFSQTLPLAVQTNITELGTITTGVWNGTGIGVAYGGTGNNTFTAYSVLCAGTTATGAFQNVSGVGTSGYVLTSNGAGMLPTWQASGGPFTPAALTEVSDTNVTLTLGGTPATALLQATSITAGWSGQLSLARGGTNASLTASAGGVVYSTGSALAILAGTATASQVLLSGSSAAPSWSTATYPATTTINQLLYSSSANTIAGLATANSGVLVTSSGGVPSIGTTLPIGVQTNITELGTVTVGTWNASIIALAYGGTNAALTASNGGIVWSNATQMQILAGTATAGQMLQSGSTATPAWSTATWPATTTQYQLLYSSFANVVSGIAVGANGVLISSNSNVPSWLANSGTAGFVLTANTGAPPSWQAAPGSSLTAPSITVYTSGSGTYTTPTSPSPLYLVVEMAGGGGGSGGSSSDTSATSGGAGGDTTFGTTFLSATHGAAGAKSVSGSGGLGGSGGGATGGDINFNGIEGQNGSNFVGVAYNPAALGGNSVLFPGAGTFLNSDGIVTAGIAPIANTGSGGSGTSGNISTTGGSGAGGGAGSLRKLISSPSATYAYAVGAGGTAGAGGASGANGAVGAAGIIIVTAYFQ